jgi:hypothetical protein
MIFGSWASPVYPEYFEVPRNYTSGVLRHVEEGLAEYAALDSRGALEDERNAREELQLSLVDVTVLPPAPPPLPSAPPRKPRVQGHPLRKPAKRD